MVWACVDLVVWQTQSCTGQRWRLTERLNLCLSLTTSSFSFFWHQVSVALQPSLRQIYNDTVTTLLYTYPTLSYLYLSAITDFETIRGRMLLSIIITFLCAGCSFLSIWFFMLIICFAWNRRWSIANVKGIIHCYSSKLLWLFKLYRIELIQYNSLHNWTNYHKYILWA